MRVAKPSTLKFLVDETVGELILKPQMAAFLIAHPMLSIEFVQRCPGAPRTDVDLILQYAPASSAPAGAGRLDEQRLLTCAAPQYLRERGLPDHPRDLSRQGHEGIDVSDGASSAWKFVNGTEELDVKIRTRAIAPSLSAALALTLGGAGVSRLPERWGMGHVRSGKLIRLLPDWELRLHLIAFGPGRKISPYAADLLRFTRNLLEMGAPTCPC